MSYFNPLHLSNNKLQKLIIEIIYIFLLNIFCFYTMTINSLFLLLLVILSPQIISFNCTQDMYQAFLIKWGRNYTQEKTSSQYQTKFNTYCENRQHVEQINNQNLTYKLNPQWMRMDLTEEETKKILKKSFSSKGLVGTPVKGSFDNLKKVSTTLPSYVDYRQKGQVSSIKNQGQCGCCWSFATVGLYETWMMFKGQKQYDLSEQYILECTTKFSKNVLDSNLQSSCDGGYPDLSSELARTTGIPLQSQYPYIASDYTGTLYPTTPGICDVSQTIAYAGNPQLTILNVFENITKNRMKELIASSPIAASIYVDDGLDKYSSGVYSGCPSAFQESYNQLNHVVVIVGYDVDGNYIIKNSWDTDWGMGGFAIISKDRDCGLRGQVYQFVSNAPPGNGVVYNRLANSYSDFLTSKTFLLMVLLVLTLGY